MCDKCDKLYPIVKTLMAMTEQSLKLLADNSPMYTMDQLYEVNEDYADLMKKLLNEYEKN